MYTKNTDNHIPLILFYVYPSSEPACDRFSLNRILRTDGRAHFRTALTIHFQEYYV